MIRTGSTPQPSSLALVDPILAKQRMLSTISAGHLYWTDPVIVINNAH